MSHFVAEFNSISNSFDVEFQSTNSFQTEMTNVVKIYSDPYQGDYEITPRLYQPLFDTNGKLMHDDLTVYEIPVTRTTNPTGGLTVLIG